MEVDGLNAGYAAVLLEEYLENPEAVPAEWRALFESAPEELLDTYPGLKRLLERLGGNGNGHAPVAVAPAPAPAAVDDELIGGVAASMALVKAYRMHGHLAARLDPLGSEPPGDPALEPERLVPKLTPGSLTGGYKDDKTRRRGASLLTAFDTRCWCNTEFSTLLTGRRPIKILCNQTCL